MLDEVDAPLDDANVERFCAFLDDMGQRTVRGFLWSRATPRMDRLLRVIMAERGVSQVVSVDLTEAKRFRKAS